MNNKHSYIRYKLFVTKVYIIILLLATVTIKATCQNNHFDVDNRLYKMYLSLENANPIIEVVERADSLARLSSERGDKNAECLFLTIPVKYYSRTNDYDKLQQACDKLRKTALSADKKNEPWYFWAYHQQALYLINNGKLVSALDIASQIHEDAERMKNKYGIYETMVVVGDIYRLRNDIGLAGENYIKAFEYQQTHLPDINTAQLCLYLGEYYRRKSGRTKDDIRKSKEYVELGLLQSEDDYIRAHLLTEKAMAMYSENNLPAFYETYRQCDTLYHRIGSDPAFLQLRYRKSILDKDYEKAMEIADSMPNDYDKQIARYVILRAQGDYQGALEHYEKANHALNLIREQERRGDLSEISARLGNYELEVTNSLLESEWTQAQSERSRTINIALTVICLIVLIALFGLIIFNRKIKRTNKKLEQSNIELTQARNKAEQSERMKMVFIQNMSHEIRTPLNAIVGFSNLLTYEDQQFTAEELKEFRDLINHNCDILLKLIDDILTLSDLDSGKYVFEYADTEINRLCHIAIESIRGRAKSGVNVSYTTNLGDSYTLNTDEVRLSQVLTNLLVNSCKHTESGEINLHTENTPDGTLKLTVTDTGHGIPEEKRYEIFERFAKLDSFNQGTGLGLSICQMIIERMKGKIYLDTNYKEGARFVVELPV